MLRYSILLTATLSACATIPTSPPEYRLDNGLWFNGEAFESRTAYIVDGALQFSNKSVAAINKIDLSGGYAVPPYCEAHNHNLGGSADGVEETVQAYLQDGVFYAMMPGSFKVYRDAIATKLNNPKSVDVAFSNNGLTGSGGHPRGLRESLMERFGLYPEFTKETLPDKGYFEADTLAELHEKWTLIKAERPDFIKVMLYFSEEYQQRKDDPDFYGRRGLNPELLPVLIPLVHDAGLRVAVHVESDADMRTALHFGADIIEHLPSSDSTARISDETITLAREANAALVTTLSLAKRIEQRSPERYAEVLNVQRDNLVRLHKAGAMLVIGSDNVRDTSRGEVNHLLSLSALDNRALLKMWTENCAQTVFPDRKIGRLADGYEASFLVLEGDPLAHFENTSRILLRVKDGAPLYTED